MVLLLIQIHSFSTHIGFPVLLEGFVRASTYAADGKELEQGEHGHAHERIPEIAIRVLKLVPYRLQTILLRRPFEKVEEEPELGCVTEAQALQVLFKVLYHQHELLVHLGDLVLPHQLLITLIIIGNLPVEVVQGFVPEFLPHTFGPPVLDLR